jgi:signal transduction histidine kinase
MVGHLFAAVLGGVEAVVVPLALLALTVSAIIVVSGWYRRRDLQQRRGQTGLAPRFELGQTPFASGTLDVATEVLAVLQQLEGRAAQQFVKLEIAVPPGLTLRADTGAFRSVLYDLLSQAIVQAPCGHVLLAAAPLGGRVQISVTDDGPNANGALRSAALRDAERLAALHGATMQVDARRMEGTTVCLRLPVSEGRGRTRSEPADPVSIWSPALQAQEADTARH